MVDVRVLVLRQAAVHGGSLPRIDLSPTQVEAQEIAGSSLRRAKPVLESFENLELFRLGVPGQVFVRFDLTCFVLFP